MRIVRGMQALARPPRRAVAALGMFDGVHLGHQRLMSTAARAARAADGTPVAVTFDPDPQLVLTPSLAAPPLMSLSTRLSLIASLGIELAWVLRFTRAFSRLSPEAFVDAVLARRVRPVAVVVGASFRFGRDRRGDVEQLARLCRRHGIDVRVVPAALRGGRPVSSSRIRALILEGAVAEAAALLGRPHRLIGTVVRGRGRGTGLGFPTANVRLDEGLAPREGVYRVWCRVDAGAWQPGAMNLGSRPTFGAGPVVCEVHVPGQHGLLYGHSIHLALHDRLRDERRFPSADALARQIRRDVDAVHALRRPPARLALIP
jgi:riboflavin kinase/FMN adenylyltransferase